MGKKASAPITRIRPLSGDSAPLGVIDTAATRGGNEIHFRGEGEPVRKDQFPEINKYPKNSKKADPRQRGEGPKSLDWRTMY